MSDSYRSTFTGSSYSDNHYGENDRRSDRDVKYYSNDGFTVEPDLPVPSRAVADTDSTWKPSKMIHVRFLGGTREHRDIATRVAAEFQRIANIHFRFMSAVDPRQADVRISFASADGYWSYIGTQALQIPAHKPTMNLGFTRNMSEEQMMGKARHEFGHLAGLVHEHQHPDGPQFKANKARDFFSRRGIKHDFDFQVMNKHTGSHYRKGEYDPDSVMHYEVPEHITKDGTSVGVNNQLSRGDKKMLQELYPRNSQKPRPADEKALAKQFETIKIQEVESPSSITGFVDTTVRTIIIDRDDEIEWSLGYQDGSKTFHTSTVIESPYDDFHNDVRQSRFEDNDESFFEPRYVRRHSENEREQRGSHRRRHGRHQTTW